MRISWGMAALLLFSACARPQKAPLKPRLTRADLRDGALGAVMAEPAWRDLIRHTEIPKPRYAAHPAASPDGGRIAYASSEFGTRMQIALRETLGVAPSQLTDGTSDNLFPRISPDGKLLAYASNKGGNWDIYVTRIDAPMAVSQLTFENSQDVCPAWSPDGKRLVYCSQGVDKVWQIVLIEVGSRVKTYLGGGLYPDWSPDANDPWITFQSQPRREGGRSGIWIVRPDGMGLREVVSDKADVWAAVNPRFSPDGRWIAYATLNKSSEAQAFGAPTQADDIWIIHPDGTMDTRLTEDLSGEWWPAWGGNRVFFISNRNGSPNVYSVQVKPLSEEAP